MQQTPAHHQLRSRPQGLLRLLGGIVCVWMLGAVSVVCAQEQPAQVDAPILNNPYHTVYMLEANNLQAPAASDDQPCPSDRIQLQSPQLRYAEQPLYTFWKTPVVPRDVSSDLAELQRSWTLTVSSLKELVDFREMFGRKTASVPLFGSTDLVHVTGTSLWVNMLDTHLTSAVHFGPYLESWKSIRKEFNGHYGLQLRMAW